MILVYLKASPYHERYHEIRKHFNQLKQEIRLDMLKTVVTANTQMLQLYWHIGKVILDLQALVGWGTKVITNQSVDIKAEFPDMIGISERNLKYMRRFAEAYLDFVQVSLVQSTNKIDSVENNANDSIVHVQPAQLT